MKRIFSYLILIYLCIGIHANAPSCICMPFLSMENTGGDRLIAGEGMFTYKDYQPFANRPIDVHYYIPPSGNRQKMPVVFVFEGGDRGYDYLLKAWKHEAEKHQFMLFIPHFDLRSYPLSDYQEVGIMDKEHTNVQPEEKQTPILIDKIFEYIRLHSESQRKGYMLYGHSAGGQFVQRFMLFHNSPYVEKAVIGSPGWYTFPDSNQDFPYGIRNIPSLTPEEVKSYLAKPIVLQLATGDTIRESFLRKTPEAELQGKNRYERGNSFYQYLHTIAIKHNWPCNWQKAEVDGIGHNSIDMGRHAVSILFSDSSGCRLHSSAQPEAVSKRFYPEPEKNYTTPTLSKTFEEGFASLSEIAHYLQTQTTICPNRVAVNSIGKTPQGKDIPILYFGDRQDVRKIRVWIQAGLHGNEPAGPEATCLLVNYLLHTPEGNALLEKISLALVPVANPDGYALLNRRSGSDYDLNRDQSKLADPVTLLLKRAYTDWNPEIALDIHEFNPIRKEFSKFRGVKSAIANDVLFLPSGHLNIPIELRQLSDGLFRREAEEALKDNGYTSGFYFTPHVKHDSIYIAKDAKSPQSSSTFQALTNAVSLFIEIRGIGLGRTSFARRTECGFLVARSILQTAAHYSREIKTILRKAIKETCAGEKEIVVTSQPTLTKHSVSFIDFSKNERFELELPALDAMQLTPVLVRKRPKAYILADTCELQVQKLRTLGIKVNQIQKSFSTIVEKYVVTQYHKQKKEWEKIHPTTVSTKLIKEKKHFPAGSYILPLAQKNANLAVSLLEPESANGFINFNVVETAMGQELPVYRKIE